MVKKEKIKEEKSAKKQEKETDVVDGEIEEKLIEEVEKLVKDIPKKSLTNKGDVDTSKTKVFDGSQKLKISDEKNLGASYDEKPEIKDKGIEKEFLSLVKKKQLLAPLEDYVRSSIHLGTRVVMPDMRKYIYKKRADGLAILNTTLIDEKLREAIDFIVKFKPGEIILVCKRDAGWNPAYLLSDLTGIRVFTKKYPAGIITNIKLSNFFQPELIIVCDPWLDKNAMKDAVIANVPFVALCDSNNLARDAKFIIPCNNKSEKSLGMVFFIIAREYCKAHGLKFDKKLEDFAPTISEFSGAGK